MNFTREATQVVGSKKGGRTKKMTWARYLFKILLPRSSPPRTCWLAYVLAADLLVDRSNITTIVEGWGGGEIRMSPVLNRPSSFLNFLNPKL
jgi:hypothetical protein